MPFAVFRKHQKKLLAIFAILAMFAFVLGDSLSGFIGRRGSGGRGGANDKVVAKLKWKTIHYHGAASSPAKRCGRITLT